MRLSRIIRKTTLLIKLDYTVEKRWRWKSIIVFMKLDAQKAASAKHLEEFKPPTEKEGGFFVQKNQKGGRTMKKFIGI